VDPNVPDGAGPVVPRRLRGSAALRAHLTLTLGLALCAVAFWFEIGRAESGNELSWAYVLEWPLLAIFAVYMWWKILHPDAEKVVLVMDNLNIHGSKSLTDYYGATRGAAIWDRLTVHYTPKHGSWLNQAEIEISLFSRRCLGRRRIPSLKMLRRQAKAWNRRINRARVKINWKFDRKAARKKFGYKYSFKRSKT